MPDSAIQFRTVSNATKGLIFAALVLPLGIASVPALAGANIQMLPPVTEATKTATSPTPCPPGGSPNILTWDGTYPISCATGVTVANGYVGIGTATMTYPLEINVTSAPINATAAYIFGNTANGGVGLILDNKVAGGDKWSIVSEGGTSAPVGSFGIYDNGLPGERMVILNNGNVGVGTTVPQAPLDVAGPIRATDNSTTCTTQNGGALRYNTTTNVFEGCSLSATQGWIWGSLGGDNRNWYNMVDPRNGVSEYSVDTTYTNNYAWSIEESAGFMCPGGAMALIYVNDVNVVYINDGGGSLTNNPFPITFTVPPGGRFHYISYPSNRPCFVYAWAEFR